MCLCELAVVEIKLLSVQGEDFQFVNTSKMNLLLGEVLRLELTNVLLLRYD